MNHLKSVSIMLFWSAAWLHGGVFQVPRDFLAIQQAIDAAGRMDTVLVTEGRYYENIRFKGKGIVVASSFILTHDPETIVNTVIDGSRYVNQDSASTVSFMDGEDSTAVLEGFTITGGSGTRYVFPNLSGSAFQEGGGIILDSSSAVIRHNLIIDNVNRPRTGGGAQNGGGGGIASMYGNPKILGNVIVSNQGGYAGGIVLNWSGGTIKNNIVYHNTGGTLGGGGVMAWYPPSNTCFIENNAIVGNVSSKDGGGISNPGTSGKMIRNNIIWANRQASGPQVTDAQACAYNAIEDFSDATNFSLPPGLIGETFMLNEDSPCIDAGDPDAVYNDPENPSQPGFALAPSKGTTRNDLGVFGGPLAGILPRMEPVSDIFCSKSSMTLLGSVGKETVVNVELVNIGTTALSVDSVTVKDGALFRISGFGEGGKTLDMFERDTVFIRYQPTTAGNFTDTLKIYHVATGVASPIRVVLKLRATGTSDVSENQTQPVGFKLFQNEPNPFNPSTRIRFNLAGPSHVSLEIYDIMGREVDRLIDGRMEAGGHQVTWRPDGAVASGVYFMRLIAGTFSETRKMVFQK